jgi:hypothetical protein
LDQTVWRFGRAIALWGFNAVQQFRADSDMELFRKILALEREAQEECPALLLRSSYTRSPKSELLAIDAVLNRV